MNTDFKISLVDIQSAAARIEPYVLKTPMVLSERLTNQLGCCLHFKPKICSTFALKARGATNAVMQLDEHTAACGVVTHSSGNHAAASAQPSSRGIPAYVVMPKNSAQNKISTRCSSTASAGVLRAYRTIASRDRRAIAQRNRCDSGTPVRLSSGDGWSRNCGERNSRTATECRRDYCARWWRRFTFRSIDSP